MGLTVCRRYVSLVGNLSSSALVNPLNVGCFFFFLLRPLWTGCWLGVASERCRSFRDGRGDFIYLTHPYPFFTLLSFSFPHPLLAIPHPSYLPVWPGRRRRRLLLF